MCLLLKGSEVCWSLLLLLHARIQMEVGELSGMLTHMNACEQAQPVLRAHVLLCRVASHSSALQVEETGPLVRGEQQKREGGGGSKEALLPCPSS